MCHRSPPYPPPPASPLPGCGSGWQWLKFYLNQSECLGQSRNSRNICKKEWNSNGENWTFNKWVCSSSKHCWVREGTSMVGIRKWQARARLFSAASPRRYWLTDLLGKLMCHAICHIMPAFSCGCDRSINHYGIGLWNTPVLSLLLLLFSAKLCLFCNPMDSSPPSSSVHGIFQASILGCHSLLQGNLPDLGIRPPSPALHVGSLPLSH